MICYYIQITIKYLLVIAELKKLVLDYKHIEFFFTNAFFMFITACEKIVSNIHFQ